MTIETGSAQNTSRPAAAESKPTGGKPGAAHGHGTGGAGGFMAVLASLGTSELAAVPGVTDGPAAITLAALKHAAAGLKGGPDADELVDASGELDLTEVDLDKLLHGAGLDPAALAPVPTDIPPQTGTPLDTAALLAQAAQWSSVPVVNAQQTEPAHPDATAGLATGLVPVGKAPTLPTRPEGPALAVDGAADASVTTELAGKPGGKAQKDLLARLASAQAALSSPTDTKAPAPDPRQLQVAQKVADAPLSPIATALAAANTVAPARREDGGRERSTLRTSASEGTAPGQSYLPSANGASAAVAPEPVTSTDTYVAEKVAYWISNDVQNAEMKLDGIGDKPVEVSIRMQGNEAHVAFRSDELQARAALENASQHLKDMLQREGLVLSGVSVGTAGAGGSGDQDRKPRQGARQVGVVSVQPAAADRVAVSGRSTGGALDLFV